MKYAAAKTRYNVGVNKAKAIKQDRDARIDALYDGIRAGKFNRINDAQEVESRESDISTLENAYNVQQLINKILYENLRVAFFGEYYPVFMAIWNKYAGKRYGEATEKKITEEFMNATGARVYVRACEYRQEVTFYTDDYLFQYNALEYTTCNDPLFLVDNVIQEQTKIITKPSYCADYCDNPAARAKKIIKAREAVKAQEDKLKALVDEYNDLIPTGNRLYFQHVKTER
jgi:hypothetical protein